MERGNRPRPDHAAWAPTCAKLLLLDKERSEGRQRVTYHLDGKTSIVSGGANGLGKAIAERLVTEGASVVIGDIDRRAGEALSESLGERAFFAPLDVTSETDW